jgi:hypothetical protein
LLADHIQPAVKKTGVNKHVSWHVFRHSYATLLKSNGADAKVVQESLRHASSRISMDVYTQAVPEHVRSAHGKVVESIALELTASAASGDSSEPVGTLRGPILAPDSSEFAVSD